MNLLVGIPAYNGLVHIDCVNTLLGMKNVTVMFIGNESLITRGRNTIVSYFYHNKSFTHLLFLDADIGIHPESIKKLILHNKDIIGAPVRLKGDTPVYNIGKVLGNEGGLTIVEKVGTAVMIISRKAIDTYIEKIKPNIYYSNSLTRGQNMNEVPQYDVFQVGVIDGCYESEDYWVCQNFRKIGFNIYVDPNIQTVHNGMFKF